jgi:hypothetical protein
VGTFPLTFFTQVPNIETLRVFTAREPESLQNRVLRALPARPVEQPPQDPFFKVWRHLIITT